MMIMKFMTIAVCFFNLVVASDDSPCDDDKLVRVEGVHLDKELKERVRVQPVPLTRAEHLEPALKKKLEARPMKPHFARKDTNPEDKDASVRSLDNANSRLLSTPEQMISQMIRAVTKRSGDKLQSWMKRKDVSSEWKCACDNDSEEEAVAECVVFWDVYEFTGFPDSFCFDTKPATCTCTPDAPAEPIVDDQEPIVEDPEPIVDDQEPIVDDQEPIGEPIVEDSETIVEDQEPIVDDQEPIVDDQDTPVIPFDGDDGSESANAEATAWVLEHNIYRCMHDVPLVEWSEEMYDDAVRSFEDNTVWAHSDRSDLEIYQGENLARAICTVNGNSSFCPMEAKDASKAWYEEVNDCTSWDQSPCIPGTGVVGHFTAMVWKGVDQIGCYTNAASIVVCRYRCSHDDCTTEDKPNMQGFNDDHTLSIYKEQVLPPNGKTYETCKEDIQSRLDAQGRRLAIFV